MAEPQVAPIIIKRKKIIAGGHHGGAWKVAYADFVTAMMAFFLLMWLLGATNEKQRIILGRRNLLAGSNLVLSVDKIGIDGAEVLKRDHCACVGKNTGHLPFSMRCGDFPPLFRDRRSDGMAILTYADMPPMRPRHPFEVHGEIFKERLMNA
jgi:hypothetical protein